MVGVSCGVFCHKLLRGLASWADVRNRLDRCEASPVEGRRLFVTHAEFDAAQRDLITRSELTSTIKALKASVSPQSPPSPSPPGVTLAEFSGLRDEVCSFWSSWFTFDVNFCTNGSILTGNTAKKCVVGHGS
jgi:hypothetical protein